MDRNLVKRLDRDKPFEKKLSDLVSEYAKLGFDSVNYWINEFDAAHDLLMAYAPLTKKDFQSLEKNHPRRFVLPMTATQLTTMATFISQMLFGKQTPHKVEARGQEDEIRAEMLNQLLKWNAEQQPTYLLGYLWVLDAVTFNRSIFYNSWRPIFRTKVVPENVAEEDAADEFGQPLEYVRWKKERVVTGGFNRMEIVSPYDFICDPSFPLHRLQDMRFSGHRFKLPWVELEARSKLPVDDPAYVRPSAVEKLKEKKRAQQISSAPPLMDSGGTASSRPDALMSRTYFERLRVNGPITTELANVKDPGNIDCIELWCRLVSEDYGLPGGKEPVVWQMLVANGDTILSANAMTYAHDQFPYSVAEGRPSGYYQFSPSWTFVLKGLQDHIDWLKNKHQEALGRTVGNVFIADPTMVDLDDFLDPDKEGQLITLKPNANGRKVSEVIQQVPIKDLTENFHQEMMQFVSYSDTVTGVNAAMQGDMQADVGSATQYAGTQQMSAGRMSAIARILSVMGLVPQTKQFVSNFQQFMDVEQVVRYQPDRLDIPAGLQGVKSLKVDSDSIQGEFDYVAHDGTLPGTDAKKVAAITRTLEAAAAFPQVFAPAPGNLDPRLLIFAAAKGAGIDPEHFTYDEQSMQSMAAGIATANMGQPVASGEGMGGAAPPQPPNLPPAPPTGGPPGPSPQQPGLRPPNLGTPESQSVGPLAVRPSNV